MSDPDTSTPAATPSVVIAGLKLPAFSSTDAAIWFRRAEVQFRLKNVRSSRTQADHVLAALPDVLFPQLSVWLDDKGDDPVEYDDLKAFLLKKFSLSPEMRVQEIFNLAQRPLGDQRPSAALTEMRALARLPPDSTGSSSTIDVLRALWLRRLPDAVRSSITDFTTHTDQDIANFADKLLDAHHATSKPPLAAALDDNPAVPDAIASVSRRPSPRRRRPPLPSKKISRRPSSTTRPKDAFASGLCFYHAKFGPKAQKCSAPCSWPKNAP